MEKEKVCSGGCCGSGCCNGMHGCTYGGRGMHSFLRLMAILLVMILIFNLGMQVGELRAEVSSSRGYEMRFEKGYRAMPMMGVDVEKDSTPVAVPKQ